MIWTAVTFPLTTSCPEDVLFRERDFGDYGKEATHGAEDHLIPFLHPNWVVVGRRREP